MLIVINCCTCFDVWGAQFRQGMRLGPMWDCVGRRPAVLSASTDWMLTDTFAFSAGLLHATSQKVALLQSPWLPSPCSSCTFQGTNCDGLSVGWYA